MLHVTKYCFVILQGSSYLHSKYMDCCHSIMMLCNKCEQSEPRPAGLVIYSWILRLGGL